MSTVSKKKEVVDNLMKAEIVQTVLTLIKTEQPVTMDEIAKQCGVAKGTLYNYFKDKHALFKFVHQTVLAPIRDANTAIFSSSKDACAKLHAFIDSAFAVDECISRYFRFVQQKRTVANQTDERFEIVMRPLIRFCSQGVQEGSFINVDPYILAEMIYGTVIGSLISLHSRENETLDKQKIKQDIICLVERIILK